MAAGAVTSDREACLAAGTDDQVSKPVRRDLLALFPEGEYEFEGVTVPVPG